MPRGSALRPSAWERATRSEPVAGKSQDKTVFNCGEGPERLIAPARVSGWFLFLGDHAQAINVFSKCSQSEVSSV